MISAEEQINLMTNISINLKKQVVAYAVGGTAMMFHGLKETTLDIDLVFTSKEDRKEFIEAAQSAGFHNIDSVKVYGKKANAPEMLQLGDTRLDLFVNEVIQFIFSKQMQERAVDTHNFNNKLILKIADFHDIILMKCATGRLKDKDDARRIIESKKIDWNIIVNEAKSQLSLGKECTLMELGCFLEHLKNKMKVNIPKQVLDKIWHILNKQVSEKNNKKRYKHSWVLAT